MMISVNGEQGWKIKKGKYCEAEACNFIRPRKDRGSWSKLVCSSHVVPRHSLISWMAVLGRLPSRDILHKWGLNIFELRSV